MINNLHHPKSVIKMDSLSLGFGYNHIQIMKLELLPQNQGEHMYRLSSEPLSRLIMKSFQQPSVAYY